MKNPSQQQRCYKYQLPSWSQTHNITSQQQSQNQPVKSQSTKEHAKMTQLKTTALLAATLVVLLAAAVAVSGQPSSRFEACQSDIDALWRTCKQYVKKEGPEQKPSSDCCKTVQAAEAHSSCICDYLSSAEARKTLSLEKVFYVTKQCGVTIPAGCGE
jgi:cell division protein FtsL